ncbi:MAG TPA: tRNA pseudouridine(55) synthase TruB [Bacillota bacterium]|nr:tRNA pseudouridine(55) synthase TruB [Bacillota bacterium]
MMDGILFINKEKNMTSHDVVNIARGALKTKRIGHTGTLDPNATGVLVLAIGRATKLVKYFTNDTKTYSCKFLIGQGFDTDDVTGNLTNEKDASNITDEELKSALNSFIGKSLQTPPDFSAVKHHGKKLYELARRDIKIYDIDPKEIEILSIENIVITRLDEQIELDADIEVSKGTYIRSIARDLGEKLNNYGCLKELTRTKVNNVTLEECYSISDLRNGKVELNDPFEYLDLPKIKVNELIKRDIDNGRFLPLELFKEKTDTIIYSNENEPLAIYYYDEQKSQMRMSVKWC